MIGVFDRRSTVIPKSPVPTVRAELGSASDGDARSTEATSLTDKTSELLDF